MEALVSTMASPMRPSTTSRRLPSRNDAASPAVVMPALNSTSRPSTSETAAPSSHTAAGAAKRQRRRQSSGSPINAAAGTANHAVVRGSRSASCLRPTSSALSTAATTTSRSRPWLRANDRSRLTPRTYPTCARPASDQRRRRHRPAGGHRTRPSADDSAPPRPYRRPIDSHPERTAPVATIAAPLRTAERGAPIPIDDAVRVPQYSVGKIAAVWAAAALPMGFLAWVFSPWLADRLHGPYQLPKALLLSLTAGLIWQFVLVAVLVGREQGSLRWSRVRPALWLNAPRSPRSGRRGGRVWLVLIPLMVALAAEELVPQVHHAVNRDLGPFLDSHAGHLFMSGNWFWFGVIAVCALFNAVLGEELLFRGFLLPRMNGAFGRRDWLANGVLFAAYHLHVPWVIPAGLLDTFIIAYPAKRYRSALIGIAVHSAQSVFFLALTLSLVLNG